MHGISSTDCIWPALKGSSGKIIVPFIQLSVRRLKRSNIAQCLKSKPELISFQDIENECYNFVQGLPYLQAYWLSYKAWNSLVDMSYFMYALEYATYLNHTGHG